MKHKAGNIYLCHATEPMPVMLVRTSAEVVLATTMDSSLNRAVTNEGVQVKKWMDINEEEMAEIMNHYRYEFLGTFPTFEVTETGEMTCIK